MLKNHLKDRIIEELGYDPTKDQINLIDLLAEFTLDLNMESIMLVKGYAGTGKTTVMSALVKVLKKNKMRYILLAPTGRAAKVLSNYSHSPAYTIHKKIYRQKSGNDSFSSFTLNKNLHSNTLFFVDEASMISNQSPDSNVFGTGRLLDDLIEYVYNGKNCRLILIG
ncbi:MAG: ATP-dependent endonuclease, partial [Marinilabiliales bacterium]